MQDYIKEKLAHYRWETNIAVSFTVFIVSIMISLFLGGTAVSPEVRYTGISLVLIAILTLFAYMVRRGLDQQGLIENSNAFRMIELWIFLILLCLIAIIGVVLKWKVDRKEVRRTHQAIDQWLEAHQ